MEITGIICEYNPLHLGHKKQLDSLRSQLGNESGIVCLMSGNYVQRGAPAVIDKLSRAKAAILSGADLVLELPVTASLSSAEGFAAEGVRILAAFCDSLCFGAETADVRILLSTAETLLGHPFQKALRAELDKGLSFPSARQAALTSMHCSAELLSYPNNILAVEYCKAILSQNAKLKPLPILRGGSYHATTADAENPSATAVRQLMRINGPWLDYIPEAARCCFTNAVRHTRDAGERAILAKLRCMNDEEFEALPHGSEGLWRKFMHAARKEATLESILTTVKSKRYTRTRLDRMLLCAFLGISQADMDAPVPYIRVLSFNDRGRQILKRARETGTFPNIGESLNMPYQALENRCGALYGLFALNAPEPPDIEALYRVYYHKNI